MARLLAPDLAQLLRNDGDWLRCIDPDCAQYWGAFRSWTWLRAKVGDHRARKHGARAARPQAGRPQRRAAAAVAQGAPANVADFAAEFAKALAGMPLKLGRGVARTGYAFGPDHVLKVAAKGCEDHNLAEFRAYQSAPEWAKPYLAPAVAIAPDGSWLLVRRASRVGEAGWQDCDKLADNLRHKVGDLHVHNVGWLDGRWVAVDYAGGMHARTPW